jgi:hypothetical protein
VVNDTRSSGLEMLKGREICLVNPTHIVRQNGSHVCGENDVHQDKGEGLRHTLITH